MPKARGALPSRDLAHRRELYRRNRVERGLPVRGLQSLPPNKLTRQELFDLVQVHRSFSAVSKATGISESAIQSWAREYNIVSQYVRSVSICAICQRKQTPYLRVHKFYLLATGLRRKRGAGSIGLCKECWERVARPSEYRGKHRLDWNPIQSGPTSGSVQSQGRAVGQRDGRSISGQKVA